MKYDAIEKFRAGRRINIEGVVLKSLAVAGVVTLAVLAPNALQLITYLDKKKFRKKKPEYAVRRAVTRLEQKGLVCTTKDGRLRLSKEGERRLHMIEFGTYPLPKERWDEQWRIVSFDVSEKRRKSRDRLRLLLGQVGFVRLQDSVWVYPYDVKEVIELIKTASFLDKEVLYITAGTTGKDKVLKSHFKLTQ